MSIAIPRLHFSDKDFLEKLAARLDIGEAADVEANVDASVAAIIKAVRKGGDKALLEYTKRFDQIDCNSVSELEIKASRLHDALSNIPASEKKALEIAHERITQYHERQSQELNSWQFEDEFGHSLGQQIRPIEHVGMYVPGGKASYPSSVLMNAIPAKVAGVKSLIMVVPTPKGEVNQLVLAAAALAGVDRVFTLGGAQAIAALAYGTETVPVVHKIVGPGNQYVASAKKQVFGKVGIDMIAGPSEILVYCDGNTDPDWIAMDLFSQAEHDELAQAILIAKDEAYIEKVSQSIERLLQTMSRAEIIEKSLQKRGAFVCVENDAQAIEVINFIAPEHLELSLDDTHAQEVCAHIQHAGAIFIGRASAETFGDYCAGSNHVLPTYGSARFSSPLSVYDFVKRSSLIHLNSQNINVLVDTAQTLADAEGLSAHAKSAQYRKHS